jgi:hypothetical protein
MTFSRNLFCFNQIINVLKILIMNLENLNLVELNAQEEEQTEGGCIWLETLWHFGFHYSLDELISGGGKPQYA